MTSTGIIVIEEGLELENPIAEIASVQYLWNQDKVSIEVHFSEGRYKHSRSYTFDCIAEWGSQDCMDALFTLPLFSENFTV